MLHLGIVTMKCGYTEVLLQWNVVTLSYCCNEMLHFGIVTMKCCYTEVLLQWNVVTLRYCYNEMWFH
jgi:hypothetical protein